MGRDRPGTVAGSVVLLLALVAAGVEDPLPARVRIDGVPFVGYHAMRAAEYRGSDVTNPSFAAVAQMMYGYWGVDFLARARGEVSVEGWTTSSGEDASLDDLKALLARGIPVHVAPATTPDAHRLYLVPKMCALLQSVPFQEPRPASGSLGEMVSHRAVEEFREGGCDAGLNDSVILASRLLIGFDDERGVFILHDPSLGPHLEVGYGEFERMWRTTGAKYMADHPEMVPANPPGRVAEVRPRTADDEAAVALLRAYGLEVTGRYGEAEPVLRQALGLEGLTAGRRHLLSLELAVTLSESGRCGEAVEAARNANAAFGGYALAHAVLAQVLSCSGDRASGREAARERERAGELCDARSQRAVADELGRDFHVMGCNGEMLGWHRPQETDSGSGGISRP